MDTAVVESAKTAVVKTYATKLLNYVSDSTASDEVLSFVGVQGDYGGV